MKLEQELRALMSSAERVAGESLSEQQGQVVAVATSRENVYYYINKAWCAETFQEEEQRFLQMLREKEDLEVLYAVCLWNGGGLDVPSFHFRQGLLSLCPQNADTAILLQGENYPVIRKLRQLMPDVQDTPPIND